MPIIQSAKKAIRQSKRRRLHNLGYKNKIKDLTKKVRKFWADKNIEEAKKLLPSIYKILDKAVKEKVIKKNTASRKKSRLTKAINKIVSNK